VNFEEGAAESWLVLAATQIIDRFPGSERLLSRLDDSLRGFCEANAFRVRPAGPHAHLLAWRDELRSCWDLEAAPPLYLRRGGGCEVVGCGAPLVVLDADALDALDEAGRRLLLALTVGHVFFGNLKLFSFHRLMGLLDQMPSVGSLITRGLGMIPVVGGTISRGLEIAKSVNEQVIRKTNLLVGMRQKVLCDRLALLATGDAAALRHHLLRHALPAAPAAEPGDPEVGYAQLVEQGAALAVQLAQGELDLHLLSILGPAAAFPAYRAHHLEAWLAGGTHERLAEGYYITRARHGEYRRAHAKVEEEIGALERDLLELHERLAALAP
jgi:hypothetical protein